VRRLKIGNAALEAKARTFETKDIKIWPWGHQGLASKNLISRWDRRTLQLNSNYRLYHAVVVKLYHV